MKRVLVTGGNSQLAMCLAEVIKDGDNDYHYLFSSKEELDITSYEQLELFFEQQNFETCINCAAYTNVELAEEEYDKALKVNATAIQNIAKLCKRFNRRLIHISTDYVFDGNASYPYKVEDLPNPLNSYGKSKLQGEYNIINEMTDYCIIRSSWLYSPYGKNFVKTMYGLLSQNRSINVVDTQIGSPTSCYHLAKFMVFLTENEVHETGIFHFASTNKASWYDIVAHMSKAFVNYPKELLKPVSDYPSKAARPNYSVLDVSKTENIYPNMHTWEEGVDEVVKILQAG